MPSQQLRMVVSLRVADLNHVLGEFLQLLIPQIDRLSCLMAASLTMDLGRKRLASEWLVKRVQRLLLRLVLSRSLRLLLCAWQAPFSLLSPTF